MGPLFWFLLIGAAAGWLAGKVTRGRGYGLLGNITLGCLGAIVGGFLFGLLGIRVGGALDADGLRRCSVTPVRSAATKEGIARIGAVR
jgi:uncharacterized membrane protein YeaQ/YmgE (transglycosylase-associated protein family)